VTVPGCKAVSVTLTEELVDALDRQAEQVGMSRSALLRGVVSKWLDWIENLPPGERPG
jgi:metal-responsive CopG/Arc/MetJ family transcriptional regulator